MITSLALMSLYKRPTIRLEEICEDFLALSRDESYRQASRGELPVVTFRLSASKKAPLMVTCEDLGEGVLNFVCEA